MTEIAPVKYVVQCCEAVPLGWIDDLRPIGRTDVWIRSNPAPPDAYSQKDVFIRCEACRKTARMQAGKNAAAVCDMVNPHLEKLPVVDVAIPKLLAHNASRLPSINDPRHVLPLGVLCDILRQLGV